MRPEIRAQLVKPGDDYRWQEHLAEVLAGVEASGEELDRATVEAILHLNRHLNRRAALRLMERFDPVKGPGGLWRIARASLLAWLRQHQDQQAHAELRKRKVQAALSEGHK
jgi:hypothetical protein